MPRYLIEREFPEGLQIPMNEAGARFIGMIIRNNAAEGVTWVHSYVSPDKKRTYCIYDAPDIEALRRSAERNELPLTQITEVRVLDPYFFR